MEVTSNMAQEMVDGVRSDAEATRLATFDDVVSGFARQACCATDYILSEHSRESRNRLRSSWAREKGFCGAW
jgi:hypothetical protein